jgi:geranylgeranyl reductase family protein
MTACDVLIVGGGPGGSTCARRLTVAGRRVIVLDRKEFPRDKTCAGWVTPQVVETLGLDLDDYRAGGRTLQPITSFLTGTIRGREVTTTYDEPVSYGIRRCEFDDYLLRRCGADLRLGTAVQSMERIAGRWIVNGNIEAPLLIGAGGHFCPVARELGARKRDGAAVVAAQEAEFLLSPDEAAGCRVDPARPELFFCPDLKGYGWCFRKADYLNVGLGRIGGENVSDHVADFCEFLKERGSVSFDIGHRFHGHAYQLYERIVPTLAADGVLLIGDAAGLAYPQSGEGIRPAIESGLLAAGTILACGSSFSETDLRPYAEQIAARFGRPRRPGVAGWLPHSWLEGLASRLLASPRFARNVVIDRWFLHRDQPVLTGS